MPRVIWDPYPPIFSGTIPATYPESISVGATDFFDVIYFLSGRGPSTCDLGIFPDITAPGMGIGGESGTSFAAPHVTGTIALMLNANPDLSVDEVESILKKTAKPLGFPHPNNKYGWGRVDALEAVKAVIP